MINRTQVVASFRRIALTSASAVAAVALVLGLANCSSGGAGFSSTGSSSAAACSALCDCVSANGGSETQCLSECSAIAASTTSPQRDCESALASRNLSSCKSTCTAFGKSASASSSASGDATATIGDFCAKCSSCVGYPGFSEGFCTPFMKTGGGFDVTACTSGGKRSSLENPFISASTLSAMSCTAFDDAE